MEPKYAMNRVENLLHRAAERLWTAFDHYWPAIGNNAIGEANILSAIAQELVAVSGLKGHMFMESPFEYEDGRKDDSEDDNKRYGRVDAVAFFDDDAAGQFVGAFEAKRIFENTGAKSILADMERLSQFGLEKSNNQMVDDKYTQWHYCETVSIVVAMTHFESISDWWASVEQELPQGKQSGGAWPVLAAKLRELGGDGSRDGPGRRGVLDSGEGYDAGRYFHNDPDGRSDPKLLYLIYPQALDKQS